MSAPIANQPETKQFQAYTKKLLDLMIHSIYSHKEIFLRELISNASDAIDKVRFAALTNPDLLAGDGDFKIHLLPNATEHTLTIADNGIGMTYDEVVENIGTIAKSGSEQFKKALQEKHDAANPDLIGQFGVGFYSAFMVAKKVVLNTCKAGADHSVRWESSGDGEYQIERLEAGKRGTTITLYLRDRNAPPVDGEDEDDAVYNEQNFTDTWTLKEIVKKYSDFIAFPVVMPETKSKVDYDDDGKPIESTRREETEWTTLNSSKALWTRQPSQIERAEYDEFYRHLTRDWQDPAEVLHFHVEGANEWTALLYIPKKAPFDLFSREPKRGLSLYIKKVFILEDCKDLIPEHFRFVKGLVDSADLPLNVSRETVQQDRLVAAIKKRVGQKIIGHFKDLLNKDRKAYEALWDEFGNAIKEGFHYDLSAKDKLAEIMLVKTTAQDGWSTLAEVIERKKEGQSALYYLTGDKLEVLQAAPQLEVFRKRGVEVILLGDAVDEIVVGALDSFGDHKLHSAAKGELDGLPQADEDKQKAEEDQKSLQPLCDQLAKLLAEDVQQVRVSNRLTDSAVCLVADKDGMSLQFEKMMAAMGQSVPRQKRILEINPDHPVIAGLRELASKEGTEERLKDYAEMLLDQALLAEGGVLKNPAKFAQRVANVMAAAVR